MPVTSKPASKEGSKQTSKAGSKPASKEGSKPTSKAGSKPASKEGSKPTSKASSKPASKERSKKEKEEEESKDKDTKKEAASSDKEKKDDAKKKEKSKMESTVGASDEKKKRQRVRREDRIDKSMALYMTVQEMKRFLVDEKLVETKIEFGGKWKFFNIFRRDPLKSAMDEDTVGKLLVFQYWRLEEAIGEDMMNVLSKTENLDGTKGMRAKDFTPGKPPPLKRVDDPAYELPWM
ncbi:unnamed protein product [Heligmosomoides polygyrus]|uniref:CHDNT domain-containing protein n=1 Tax=Heligmosomoides polygyrus TaxID=6339 RepID=A0A3P7XHK9_HELPZ|nr:unnamed protein product [Heligmosomoides polygyrus]